MSQFVYKDEDREGEEKLKYTNRYIHCFVGRGNSNVLLATLCCAYVPLGLSPLGSRGRSVEWWCGW